MTRADAKTHMLEHSQAKVELYSRYLSTYLSVLRNVASVQMIYLFDLLAGEGVYEDGSKGSALAALDVVKNHYFAHGRSCPDLRIWFNDNGVSLIDPPEYKIDRIRRFASRMFIPPNVRLEYHCEDYDTIWARALSALNDTKNAKGLFFLDPYGYKAIDPEHIRKIMLSMDAELLLFLPASPMYRFAAKASTEAFRGGEPLHDFLGKLFGDNIPAFRSVYDFVARLKQRLREYIGASIAFVDTFTPERDASNVYCLFFFTTSALGCEKMLEAKWKLDQHGGRGHSIQRGPRLFGDLELSVYPEQILRYIQDAGHRTNHDLYRFGLERGFLPKHTNEALSDLRRKGRIVSSAVDGLPVRGNYVQHATRRCIAFALANPDQQSS
jgi:three-Cys-motif partner protein